MRRRSCSCSATLLLLGINELRAADAKLTLLTRKVVQSQEAERAWLSRELHDDTSQTLVSVKLLVESALDRPAAQERRQRAILQRALARINDALIAVRDISHRLRPAELDTLGLTTALQRLGEEMCEPAGTAFELQVDREPAGLPDEIRTTLFRVSQEALDERAQACRGEPRRRSPGDRRRRAAPGRRGRRPWLRHRRRWPSIRAAASDCATCESACWPSAAAST